MGWRTAPPFGVWIPPNLSKYWNAGQKKQTSESPWLFPSDPLIFTVITVRDWGAGIISLVGLVALIGFHRLRCRRINSLASLVHIVRNVQWCFASKRQTDRIQWEDIWNMLSVTYIIKGASLLSSTYSSPIAPFHSIHVHTSIRIDLRIHIWTRKTAPGCLNQFNKSCHLFLFQRCLFRIVFRPRFKNHTPNSSLQILDFQIVTPISWFAPLLWSEYVIWLMIWYNQDSWWNLPSKRSNDELWWTRNHKGSAVLISLVWFTVGVKRCSSCSFQASDAS